MTEEFLKVRRQNSLLKERSWLKKIWILILLFYDGVLFG